LQLSIGWNAALIGSICSARIDKNAFAVGIAMRHGFSQRLKLRTGRVAGYPRYSAHVICPS
jgi:hypothetical protein